MGKYPFKLVFTSLALLVKSFYSLLDLGWHEDLKLFVALVHLCRGEIKLGIANRLLLISETLLLT